jgi:hypothetical protein
MIVRTGNGAARECLTAEMQAHHQKLKVKKLTILAPQVFPIYTRSLSKEQQAACQSITKGMLLHSSINDP